MKKKFVKLLSLATAMVVAVAGFTGCGKREKELSGSITLAGSTSMEKVCEALMEGFMEKYSSITVTTEYTGSGAGLESLAAGSVDIGNASRHVKDEEKTKGAVENVIALDGVAVITDADNKVTDLTKDQLCAVYKGEIKNWKELGGEDEAIVVIGRENGSGTRSAFEELIHLEETDGLTSNAAVSEGNGPVQIAVAGNENAIGYVSFAYIDDTVKQLTVDGVEGIVENVKNKTYALSRPFLFVSKDDKVGEAGKKFLEFALSADGQACVEKDNAIRIDQ